MRDQAHGRPSLAPVLPVLAAMLLLAGCTNNPYRPGETAQSTYFSSFSAEPTKLDPANSYYAHEGELIDQIYEPPFTYHYLKRPYQIIPLTAEAVPRPVYFDSTGRRIEQPDPPPDQVARAEYTVRLKRGIRYQNHPCFAREPDGRPVYRGVSAEAIRDYAYPSRFPRQGTREVTARDYELGVRRLADPRLASPVFSTLARYIDGLTELNQAYTRRIAAERARRRAAAGAGYNQERDERAHPLRLAYLEPPFPGFQVLDDHTFKIVLKKKYPQILYWMCMHFFAPVPQEALDFYAQPALIERQFSLRRCPVGSGPYYMDTFRPNEVIMLKRNPNYHPDFYPAEGMPEDQAAGLLADAGKRLPFIDTQVFRLEKEAIPRWNKFLQGYYDASGIAGDVFDQAIDTSGEDQTRVSEAMRRRGIRLVTAVDTMFWYLAFNQLDDVVGGQTPEKRKLRRAISIALEYNEYLDIFANGRGIAAQGPIPPGIFGYRGGKEGTNPYTSRWNPRRRRNEKLPIDEARRLLAEAGYPGGRAPDGTPLTLYWDHSQSGNPTFRSVFDWTRNRLALLGIRLKERPTDLSRMREKRMTGNWQITSSGWIADYPDPENFLFLFYGPNGKVKTGGANATNYENPAFDRLFIRLASMENGPRRQALIDQAIDILQRDAPAVWEYFPVSYSLMHAWYKNYKPHQMSKDVMRYRRVDAALRVQRQREWNRPVVWPMGLLGLLLVLAIAPAAIRHYRRERGLS